MGYLNPSAADPSLLAEIRWSATDVRDAGTTPPYIYVGAIWPSPFAGRSILFGGMPQGGGSSVLLESGDGGRSPTVIPMEGDPAGQVVGIVFVAQLDVLVVVTADPDRGVYLLRRRE